MPDISVSPDFGGWATKNDLECSDGRIICSGAFAVQDGAKVPLLWNHTQNSPSSVLGHAVLQNRAEGVWADCFFNESKTAQTAKEAVKHGDIDSLSIYANKLSQDGQFVRKGTIREVSLVVAGANPGAIIESIAVHGEPLFEDEDEGQLYTGEPLVLYHADSSNKGDDGDMADEKDEKTEGKKEKTVQDVLDTLNPEQKRVVTAVIGMALEAASSGNKEDDSDDDNKKEEGSMSHNAFENNGAGVETADVCISHSDMAQILKDARVYGSLRESWKHYVDNREEPILMHSGMPVIQNEDDFLIHGVPTVPTTGMTVPTGHESYGFQSPDMFYPDDRALANTPEFIGRRTDWVNEIMSRVHHTPFSRIKSLFADITEDEARAKGYIKGNEKKTEVFKTLKRVTHPTTVYKLQKLDRDDIIDITDFDIVSWIRSEMNVMLEEEIARAILIGDGRDPVDTDKISEESIRPIAKDVDLFNTKVHMIFKPEATGADKAKLVMDEIIRAHKNYRGSGNPTLFTTEDWLTEMLLLEDKVGHKLYKTPAELATALRVAKIVTIELMAGQKVGGSKDEDLIAVIVNPADYNIGQDPKGQQSMFDDFDIDYNQYKYLIERRMSGALTKPFSAITVSGKEGE